MKKVILIVLLIPSLLSAQVSDDFETGTCSGWIQYPAGRWSADAVTPLEGSYSLHHSYDINENGNDRIGIRVNNFHPDEGTSEWSFLIKHGFAPSSTNNWGVFLMSDVGPDQMTFSTGINGFAMGVNMTGSDDLIKLIKVKNGTVTPIITTSINWESSIGISQYASLKVERSAAGEWAIFVSKQDGSLIGSFSGVDPELFNHEYFGLIYRYISTKIKLLWIDNIKIDGVFYSDEVAPFITAKNIVARNSVSVSFNEKIPDTYLEPGNFTMNSIPAAAIKKTSETSVLLTFEKDLENKQENTLLIMRICDASGNCSENLTAVFTPLWAETGDVIISEIMPDPSPSVSLPEAEYVEIMNRTGYSFSMSKWRLFAGGSSYLIPDAVVSPGEMIILCSQKDTTSFSKFGKTCGLRSFPSLLNEGMLLYIADSTGMMIHGMEYEQSWYDDALKSTGGWSLEMKDKNFPFLGDENWKASSSRTGGTPGGLNSVEGHYPDSTFNGLINVFATDPQNVSIQFSEPVIGQEEVLKNITVDGNKIINLETGDPLRRTFMASVSEEFKTGTVYELIIPEDLADFAGNHSITLSYSFALTQTAAREDIIINELLFNPFPDCPDYIEFYNRSLKAIDASRLYLISINDQTSDTSELYHVSEEQRCMLPGSYYVITTGKEIVLDKYPGASGPSVFEISSLPSMPDDKGHLILLNRELDVIDDARYDENMHYPFVTSHEGVALERGPGGNWHSASASSGWGTPGKKNSNEYSDTVAPSIVKINISGRNSVSVTFSEQAAEESLKTDNFLINSETAALIEKTGNCSVSIYAGRDFQNKKENTLLIKQLCDTSGNCSDIIILGFKPVWPEPGDVIITEIMADPSPAVSLPDAEYIELTNRSNYSFATGRWKISAGDDDYYLPESVISPGEIFILCSVSDTSVFSIYGKTVGLTSFPTLTNEGMILYLSDNYGSLIHGIEYNPEWYGEELKSSGGWSLEMIDRDFPFYGKGNWKASVSKTGGTPGSVNSVSGSNPDAWFEGLVNVFAIDRRNILMEFSESLINQEEILENTTIGGQKPCSIKSADPLFRSFIAETTSDLESGITFNLKVPGEITDFAGNHIISVERSFGLTETASKGDIIFNELLFNPSPGYPDYIEFYNSSGKSIDASRLFVLSIDDATSDTSGMYQVSSSRRCILPGTYYVITTDREMVLEKYFVSEPALIFNLNGLPSMPDDKGHLALLNRELELIDEISYNEKMHYSLINDHEGKALERISAGIWHTAAETDGWGTPGKGNSVVIDQFGGEGPVTLSSSKITPDGDGYEDILQIELNFQNIDNVLSVAIYDETGSLVKEIARNMLTGPKADIIWDGTAEDGAPVPTGIYIVFISYYNDKGDTGKWKKVCTVIRE